MKKGIAVILALLFFVPSASAAQPGRLNAAEEVLIARFCAEEAPGEALLIHMGIAAVMLNRMADERYPNTASGAAAAAGFAGAKVKEEDYRSALWAVRCVSLGMDPTDGAVKWARKGSLEEREMDVTLEADGWCFGR